MPLIDCSSISLGSLSSFFDELLPERLKNYQFPKGKKNAPKFSWRYMQLETAKEWGMTPEGFDKLEVETRAEMMAFNHVHRLHEAFVVEEAKIAGSGKK